MAPPVPPAAGAAPGRSAGLAASRPKDAPAVPPPGTGKVRVTEADRVAWMRQFLNALEQWKSFLDSLLPATEAASLTSRKPEEGQAALPPLPGGGGACGTDPSAAFAVYAATAQAQQAQYFQQYQFWQRVRQHEAQRMGKGGAAAAPMGASGPTLSAAVSTRFKDNFRPMRLCKHLTTMGFCRQGEQCTFAHNYEELHLSSADLPKPLDEAVLPPLLPEQLGASVPGAPDSSSHIPDLRLKKKKELCGRFSRGYCSLGKVCSFAHGEEELNTVGLAICGKVKTQLCRNWEAGRCVYGANCNNAHGELEIGTKRPPPELAPPNKRRREDEGDLEQLPVPEEGP